MQSNSTIVAPDISGSQDKQEWLKKTLSERGAFAQFELKLWEFRNFFQTNTDNSNEKCGMSPINDKKTKFYVYIADRIRTLMDGVNIMEIPDMMDGIRGYTKPAEEMRILAKKIESLEKVKPWKLFPDSGDEIPAITNLLSDLFGLVENLKLSLGGWSKYF